MQNILNIVKSDKKSSENTLKMYLVRNRQQNVLSADKYAIDPLRNKLYLRLSYSNTIISYDCCHNNLTDALINLPMKNKGEIVELDNINWNNIPYEMTLFATKKTT